MKNKFFRGLFFSLMIACLHSGAARASDVVVFAAASLINVLENISNSYHEYSKTKILISYQSSGVLARQIQYGAPAAVFVSAHQDWIQHLVTRGHISSGEIKYLASNQLVLISNSSSNIPLEITLSAAISGYLGRGPLIIGDPGHVPAGRYAKAALTTLGLWQSVRSRTARASNVREVLAFIERGAAPLGIVYTSDAQASAKVRVVAKIVPTAHAPIVYSAGLITSTSTPDAREFFDYLFTQDSARILARHGFSPAIR